MDEYKESWSMGQDYFGVLGVGNMIPRVDILGLEIPLGEGQGYFRVKLRR
jgi:hypothetical protein